MDRYIISVEEIAIYEINADSAKEAKEEFEAGGGDFVGYDEKAERLILVEKVNDGLLTY